MSAVTSVAVAMVTIAIVIHHYKDDSGLKQSYTAYGRPITKETLVSVALLITTFVLLALYFISDLLVLHVRLLERGWTTYDYIVHLREQDRRKEAGEKLDRPLGYPCGGAFNSSARRSRKVAPLPVSSPSSDTIKLPITRDGRSEDGSVTPPHGTVDVFHVVTHPLHKSHEGSDTANESDCCDSGVGGVGYDHPQGQSSGAAPQSDAPSPDGDVGAPPPQPSLLSVDSALCPPRRIGGRLPPLSPVEEMSREASPQSELAPLTQSAI